MSAGGADRRDAEGEDGPDIMFHNGGLFDGVHHQGPRAVGIRGRRVWAIGELDDVRRELGPGAEEVDLEGGLLLPGFIDAHMHPMVGGLERLHCEMTELSGPEEYLETIARAAARRPDDAWVRGGGWSVGAFGRQGPTAELLDRVVADRPVFLPSSDHHDAWVNTRALDIAGVDANTPDPPDGWVERDADGRPTGTLREAAMALVGDHVETSREEYADAMREAQDYLHSWGITGWHDALVGGYAGLDDPTQAYLDLLAAGELTARVRCSLWWDRHRGTEQIEELATERDRLAAAGLDAGSVKVMMDGISETFTASLSEAYRDLRGCPCGDHGLAFLEPEQVQEAVTALDAAGFQVHFHAIGDRAVHDALDAVEAARRANGINDLRHQIAHLQLVRPEDRPRFRRLGVVACIQGMWAHADDPSVQLLRPHLDEERASWQYPFADLVAAGAATSGGSDWPVQPPEPIGGVHTLVNRSRWTEDGAAADPLGKEQGMTLERALSTYTSGSARANHHPEAGAVVVGAPADLAVLDRNPFDLPAGDIGACEVTATFVRGVRVFER